MFKVAITGKGGVGKTTISGTIARLLARDGYDVLAIDADPDMNLASSLGITTPPKPLTEYREMIEERAGQTGGMFKYNPKVDDVVEKYGAVGPDNVNMLVMGTVERGGSGCMCPASAFLRALLRHVVLKDSSAVIMDMEAGIEHLGRGTTKGIDLMLIKKLSDEIGIRHIAAVINKSNEADMSTVLEDIGIPVIGEIPFSSDFIEADLQGLSPIDLGGDALESIKNVRDNMVDMITSFDDAQMK